MKTQGVATPNLFHYATSELSQDAFICWLLRWADSQFQTNNEVVHGAGKSLLEWILSTKGKAMPSECKIEIMRQYKKVDVLAILNESLAIIVEDKTQTTQHDNQLTRYVDEINKRWEDYIPIYLQTGDQSDYSEVIAAEYQLLHRRDFLNILRPFYEKGSKSDVFDSFFNHLQQWESSVQSFLNTPIEGWGETRAWTGFLKHIAESLPKLPSNPGNSFFKPGWGYVANPSGGFMGSWWGGIGTSDQHVYLQTENDELTIKLGSSRKEERRSLAHRLSEILLNDKKLQEIGFEKPSRIRIGQWTTIGKLSSKYIEIDSSGILVLDETLNLLKRVTIEFVRAAKEIEPLLGGQTEIHS